jgi:ferredoxin
MKGYNNNLRVNESQPKLYREFEKLKLEIVEEGQLNEMKEQDDLEDHIRQAQKQCPET